MTGSYFGVAVQTSHEKESLGEASLCLTRNPAGQLHVFSKTWQVAHPDIAALASRKGVENDGSVIRNDCKISFSKIYYSYIDV